MLDEISDSVSQLPGVFLFYNESGLALVYDVGDAALVACNTCDVMLHRFQEDKRETFIISWKNKEIGFSEKFFFLRSETFSMIKYILFQFPFLYFRLK